jgi:hypothetical protein
MTTKSIIPTDWNAKRAADEVLGRLVNVCLPQVKGAHDSDLLLVGEKAYIVYEANDIQPGENPAWPFIYVTLSVVDVPSGRLERVVTFAASGMAYDNETLPEGACFVPRIIQKDEHTLRCFFASENPGKRESQTWFVDYGLAGGAFERHIHRAWLATDRGVLPMQPRHAHALAAARGFTGLSQDYGLYMIDWDKRVGGQRYCVINHFTAGHNALARIDPGLERFTIVGHFFEPAGERLTEAAVNRLRDGRWLAISRQDGGDCNYRVSRSRDGKIWDPHEPWALIPNGANSKPTFDCFGGVYYVGWQEATQVGGAFRSVFNIEVSGDGENWERKYRFESDRSFQYPTFREHGGAVYLTVTQGDSSDSRKERIMFGRLE